MVEPSARRRPKKEQPARGSRLFAWVNRRGKDRFAGSDLLVAAAGAARRAVDVGVAADNGVAAGQRDVAALEALAGRCLRIAILQVAVEFRRGRNGNGAEGEDSNE